MARRPISKKFETAASRDAAAHRVPRAAPPGLAAGLGRQLQKLLDSQLDPGLYIVSTPIGNLGDISIRALFVLSSADAVFCEDTRHSRKLFSAYGIHNRLQTYHDFSTEKDRDRILALLGQGKRIALISDAGTPLIADPGFKLVRGAVSAGIPVFAIPGPSALLAALISSGLPSDRFFFEGFLPAKEVAKKEAVENLRTIPGTIIFYETGSRLESTLNALDAVFPARQIAIARELTKRHEAILRGIPQEVLSAIGKEIPPGEFVVLIGPGRQAGVTDGDVESALRKAMSGARLREAVEEVAKGLGVGRKLVYNLALQLRDKEK